MRKILFLDIDGVVNSAEVAEREYNKNGVGVALGIDTELANRVKQIIKDTNCEVVLSSSWRTWPDGRDQVRKQVVEFIDVTPYGGWRGQEIQRWLIKNDAEDARYAILDDSVDMLVYQAPNFFKTTFQEGLTPEIAKAVTEHLNA